MENRANNTIAENIRKAIENFDNIENALQTQRMDTTNKNVEEYSNLIEELSNTNDATATADDIISFKTAYINGEKVEGNIQKEFEKTSLIFGSYITNNTGLGVYDIRYDLGYVLVGNRDATDFYICKIVNDVINLTNATKFNILTNVSSSRSYMMKDLKFNVGNIENNILRIYGIGNYHTTSRYASNQYLWHRIFAIDYNVETSEFSVVSTEFTDSCYVSPNNGYTPDMNDYITIIEKDLLLYKAGKVKNYGLDYRRVINPPRRIFKFENNAFSTISSFTRPHDASSIYDANPTNSYISKKLYIEYKNDTYLIYSLDASYNFTLIKSGTDHASNRVAIIANDWYLLGNSLYDTNNNLLATYTEMTPSLYKLYANGYIYEFNTNAKTTNIYKFDEDTFGIELINTIASTVSSYGIDVVAINSRPLSVYNDYICYASTNGKTYYIDYSGTSEIVKTLIRTDIRYTNTNDTTAKAEHIVIGKSAYLSGEKVKGTMPNHGILTYTPSNASQALPKGYIEGGMIEPINYDGTLDLIEYKEALKTSNAILGTEASPLIFSNGEFEGINTFKYTALGGATTGKLTIGTNIVTSQSGSGGSGAEYKLVSDVPIDFTNISKLEIEFSTTYTSKTADFKIAIPTSHSSITSWNQTVPDILYSTTGSYSGTMSLDVSNYTGNRYLLFRISSGTYGANRTVTIKKIKAI